MGSGDAARRKRTPEPKSRACEVTDRNASERTTSSTVEVLVGSVDLKEPAEDAILAGGGRILAGETELPASEGAKLLAFDRALVIARNLLGPWPLRRFSGDGEGEDCGVDDRETVHCRMSG